MIHHRFPIRRSRLCLCFLSASNAPTSAPSRQKKQRAATPQTQSGDESPHSTSNSATSKRTRLKSSSGTCERLCLKDETATCPPLESCLRMAVVLTAPTQHAAINSKIRLSVPSAVMSGSTQRHIPLMNAPEDGANQSGLETPAFEVHVISTTLPVLDGAVRDFDQGGCLC